MKKTLIIFCLLALSLSSFAQTCEQREQKLLGAMGALSAGCMYNSYLVIGGMADGIDKKLYDTSFVIQLMNEQKLLLENLSQTLEELISKKSLRDKADIDYAGDVITVFKGLVKQAEFTARFARNPSKANAESFQEQRKKNWEKISELMGLEK